MANQSRNSKYALNAIANWVTVAFVAVVSFVMSPFIVQHLGATRYGVWSLTAGLVGYLGLLDLGIRQAVSRYVAHNHAVSDHEENSLIVSAALRLFGIIGFFAVLLAGLLAYFTPILFNIPEAMIADVRAIVVLGGLSMAASLVGGVFGGVVTGLERFDAQCGLEIATTVVRSGAIVFALRADYGLVALAVIQLSSQILNCALYWMIAHKLYAKLKIRWTGELGPQMRTILSFSATLTVLYALGKIISYSDTAVIGAFLPIDAVTSFVIAGSLCLQAREVPRSLSYLMAPRISAMMSIGNNRVGDEIAQVARIATLLSASIATTFVIRGESFISLWMGPEYGPLSGQVLRILAIVVWLDASRSVMVLSLTGMAKQSTVIPGLAIEAACNLALSLLLVRPLGLVGVALGSMIPGLIVSIGYLPHQVMKSTGFPAGLLRSRAVVVPTLACIPFALATALVERFIPTRNLLVFFLQVFLLLPLVPVAAWFVCFTSAERERAKEGLRQVLKR